MRLRRLMRAAGPVPLILALLAPAVATGTEWWWFDHKQGRYPVASLKKTVEPTFNGLSFTTTTGKEIGPCKGVGLKGEIYSRFEGMGEAEFFQRLGSAKECETTIKECAVEKIEPSAAKPEWTGTLKADKTMVLSKVGITVEMKGKCEGIALPGEFTVSGTLEATWLDHSEISQPEIKFDTYEVSVEGTKLFVEGGLIFGTEVVTKVQPEGFAPTFSPAVLKGSEQMPFELTREGSTVKCLNATLEGTVEDGDTTLSLAPTMSNCSVVGAGFPATVTPNDCKFLFHLNAEASGEETYKYFAPTDLKCEEGELEVEIFLSKEHHMVESPFCSFAFGETGNQSREVVELTNEGSTSSDEKAWIQAHVDVEDLTSERIGSPFCGSAVDTEGTLVGAYAIAGETGGGGDNGIGVFPG
jgi:hypothetical protein